MMLTRKRRLSSALLLLWIMVYCFLLKTSLKQCHDWLLRNKRFSSYPHGAPASPPQIQLCHREFLFGEVSKLVEGHLEALFAICELRIVLFNHILVNPVRLETSALKDLAAAGYIRSI